MCGIAGYHDPGGLREESALSILGAMTSVLQHRGPDDCGVWCAPPAGDAFGHRRLSILDLSPLGQQPMESASGDRKSTRLNSSHGYISYAVVCLKKNRGRRPPGTRRA